MLMYSSYTPLFRFFLPCTGCLAYVFNGLLTLSILLLDTFLTARQGRESLWATPNPAPRHDLHQRLVSP